MQEQRGRKPNPALLELSNSDLKAEPPAYLGKTDSDSEIVSKYQLSWSWSLGSLRMFFRMGLMFALLNSQGDEDHTIKHHIHKLKREPEPPSRGLLPSLIVPISHFSSVVSG